MANSYTLMTNIVMADIVTAYIVMACMFTAAPFGSAVDDSATGWWGTRNGQNGGTRASGRRARARARTRMLKWKLPRTRRIQERISEGTCSICKRHFHTCNRSWMRVHVRARVRPFFSILFSKYLSIVTHFMRHPLSSRVKARAWLAS